MSTYYGTVEEDAETGDAIIVFPEGVIEEMGFKEGDELNWTIREDGSVLIEKA